MFQSSYSHYTLIMFKVKTVASDSTHTHVHGGTDTHPHTQEPSTQETRPQEPRPQEQRPGKQAPGTTPPGTMPPETMPPHTHTHTSSTAVYTIGF